MEWNGMEWNGLEWNMVVVPMNETRPFNESSTLGNHSRYNEKMMFKSIMQKPKNDKIKMSFFAKRVGFKT
jgi:hypothetical protein